MSPIRPLERGDIPQVAALYESVARSGSRTPAPHLGAYFERTLLDHPWADPEIPSLVYEVGDRGIMGFLGSHVRHLRVEGKPIRATYVGQFATDRAVRGRGAGALLLHRFLAGPQDLTLTDDATAEVPRMWERLGGRTSPLESLAWLRFLRPFRFAETHFRKRSVEQGWERILHPACLALDTFATRLPGNTLRVASPPTQSEELTPRTLLEIMSPATEKLRFSPDYDEEFLEWLFGELARVPSRGILSRRLVRDREGQVLGWYVALMQPGGSVHVLQMAATGGGDIGAVMEHLLFRAWQSGATVLRGRLEPHLLDSVRRRHCHVRHGARPLVYSRDTNLTDKIISGGGLLTRMDGESWLGHNTEAFT